MELLNSETYGYGFVPTPYLPEGNDEYWIRNLQAAAVLGEMPWRNVRADEIAILEQNGCRAGNWNDVLVVDPFDPAMVRNSAFYGLVRLGRTENKLLKHHDFCVPVGIRNSTIISCDIGDYVSIQDCSLVSHYIIGKNCICSRIDELVTTNHTKFGNGIVKEGEDEDVRIWIDVMNEAGGRSILPFVDMIPADAFLWAAWRDDTALVEKLREITQETQALLCCGGNNKYSPEAGVQSRQRGFYGTIGRRTLIKSCRIIKDTMVGESAYIKGVNKLKNLTILSCEDEATQIGEGVELVNGIVGYGCHVFYGAKAVRFVLGRHCSLKYGARLIHSVLGDNSTVSCCEILNNLVFPVHEQHHNNSFLIASLIEGTCNMAAAATVGSNHNSRANDGEIRAGRGFWPGLSVTLKHSSRFASFCLIAKGDFPYELNIPLPFSLVINNVHANRLEVMPAYFWLYNLFALERNSWKTKNRDRRFRKEQYIETEYMAPDTAGEIIKALELIQEWMSSAGMNEGTADFESDYEREGKDEYHEYDYSTKDEDETIPAFGLERHTRPVVILKPRKAMAAYKDMLFYYGMKTTICYLENQADFSFEHSISQINEDLNSSENKVKDWINMGGQIVPAFFVDALRKDIREGNIKNWKSIHARYDEMAAAYEKEKACHAWKTLSFICGKSDSAHPLEKPEAFKAAMEKTVKISDWIRKQVYVSRAKDFHNPFRIITYRNKAEMDNVVGTAKDSSFVKQAEKNHRRFTEKVESLMGKF
ncbi:MAG: DUF4954 family protein [Treponema sp.]|nr:DUF4954 family protein [Treponema sp.]